MTTLITAIDLVISLFVLVLSLFVLLKDPNKKINQIFGITIFFFSSWIISSSLSDITGFWGSDFWALWFARAAIIGPFLFCPLFLYFTYYFPRESRALSPWKIAAIFAIPTVSVFFFHTDYNVESVTLESWGTGFSPGSLYLVLLFCLLGYFGLSLYRLAKAYRSAVSYHEKSQVFYVFIAVITFVAIGILTNIVLPVYGIAQLSVFGPAVSMLIFGTLTAYAILKHHLLDIWLVVRMGTIFAIVFALVSFLYVGGVSLLSNFIGGTTSLLITSFLITISFESLKRFAENSADRLFFSRHYKADDIIDELTSAVHNIDIGLDLKKILKAFNDMVRSNFKVESAAIVILTSKETFIGNQDVLSGEEKFIELNVDNPLVNFLSANQEYIINREEILQDISDGEISLPVERIELLPGAYEVLTELDFIMAIPIASAGKLIAIHCIGPKKSNDLFTHQDTQLLNHLTGEAGVLINNARLYDDLKKLDEAKSNFISVVSHQLRTPLSAVRWTTELLLAGSVDKDSEEEFLKDTYKNSLFMIYQLDDMLTALEVEDREIEIKSEKCILTPFIEEILKENEVIIRSKKLEIKFSPKANEEEIFCDHKKIKKVIEILVRNAIRYSPDSGGKVDVSMLVKTDGDEKILEVSVSDNGIGISPEEERYVFEKFFRGEEAKKISPNGFGLGLFIVRAFARAHGGEAHFESEGRNKGARFYFKIKLDKEPSKKFTL